MGRTWGRTTSSAGRTTTAVPGPSRPLRRRSAGPAHASPPHPPLTLSSPPGRGENTEPAMPIQSRYLFSAAMDVEPAQERLFNEVYDQEHVPSLLTVPGVVAVSRYEMQPLRMSIGGQLRTIVIEGAPRYGAL